ncbi:EGF-domain O-GlcNAc transferase [Arctopsyche grandis]|uniref:EGF-domain O-GlcNAc transferase n=1 Tax=Arctopsyche grandis TaxID=121162 RepID=UPI00406D6CF8
MSKLKMYILNSYIYICFVLTIPRLSSLNISSINFPEEHLPQYFTAFPNVAEECAKDDNCVYKQYLNSRKCWGYESYCTMENGYKAPSCPGDHKGWVKSKQAQFDTFFSQADFGYVKEQLKELKVMCEPLFIDDSSLECSQYMRFCRGRNLMLNFTNLIKREDNLRYKMDILGPGQIGGYCKVFADRLVKEAEHISPLQSWGPEMRHFVSLNNKPINDNLCDVVIEKPTYIMKIDATVNMYHHFCDFFNLYTSLHVNLSHPHGFSKDNHILIWETYTYESAFKETWNAFTNNPIWDLKTFRGEVVCFKNVVFPLLPRMIFGLYYNTPIIYGCEKSGLFHAFSKHVLNGLNIKLDNRNSDKIRITLLSRETKYRTILNEVELIDKLNENDNFIVNRVVYNRSIPFSNQLTTTHNTDIFIGMHGAGLTHLLFLPDWAVVFELYNCEDSACYSDLARLRGVKYVTWENEDKIIQQDEGHHPEGGSHPKFTNYAFDVDEFIRLVNIGVEHVRSQSSFLEFVKLEQNISHEEL